MFSFIFLTGYLFALSLLCTHKSSQDVFVSLRRNVVPALAYFAFKKSLMHQPTQTESVIRKKQQVSCWCSMQLRRVFDTLH